MSAPSSSPPLDHLDLGLTPAAFAARRWFRSKGRPIAALSAVDAVPLPAGSTPAVIAVVRVDYASGAADRYLLPGVVEAGRLREPHDGDGVWRAIVGAIAEGGSLPGTAGRFSGHPTRAMAPLVPPGGLANLAERSLGVEQTNTSVVLGDRLILKLYRRLEPGINIDLEVSEFLSRAGFPNTPPLAGSLRYLADDGEPCAAAMVQALVPTSGDAWAWMRARLAEPHGADEALEAAEAIGRVTAQLHAALASRPRDAGFEVRTATAGDGAAWHATAIGQLDGAIEVLSGQARERVTSLAPRLRRAIEACDASGTRVRRIHGDYHLGQLLATERGFMVIDFEGEPARPLAERRAAASPLKDLAGMLRSFDYLARSVVASGAAASSFQPDAWLAAATRRLRAGYGPITPRDERLLGVLVLEKALYEVRYEADNRPDWLWLPLAALERLAADTVGR